MTDKHDDMEEQRRLAAALDWLIAMGVDQPVGAEPVTWRSAEPRAPGAGFIWPGQPDAPPAATVVAGHRSGTPPLPSAPRTASPSSAPPAGLRTASPLQGEAERARPAASAPPAQAPPGTRIRASSPAAASEARTAANSAETLDGLHRALSAFDGCGLKATAKSLCFYRGAATARLMIVGEAPGRDEDIEGRPFVGRAGQLLDRMLAAIGYDESNVHITNVVYWRPPGNRTPTPEEGEACRPFLERQIALVKPEVLLVLGGTAAKQVLGLQEGILKARGQWHDAAPGGHNVRAMASLHPAYLLRSPAAKRQAWRDFLAVRHALETSR